MELVVSVLLSPMCEKAVVGQADAHHVCEQVGDQGQGQVAPREGEGPNCLTGRSRSSTHQHTLAFKSQGATATAGTAVATHAAPGRQRGCRMCAMKWRNGMYRITHLCDTCRSQACTVPGIELPVWHSACCLLQPWPCQHSCYALCLVCRCNYTATAAASNHSGPLPLPLRPSAEHCKGGGRPGGPLSTSSPQGANKPRGLIQPGRVGGHSCAHQRHYVPQNKACGTCIVIHSE